MSSDGADTTGATAGAGVAERTDAPAHPSSSTGVLRRKAVFVSYASEDTAAAARLAEALRETGIDVWFDRSELRGGDAWDAKIRRHIRDCTLFMPVISANAAARHEGYFRFEWLLADERSRMIAPTKPFIVPVTIDGTLEADVPDSFHRVQWTRVDAGLAPPEFCRRVVELLDAAPVGSAAAKPTVGAPAAAGGGPRRATLVAGIAAGLALVVGGAWYAFRAPEERSVAAPASQKTIAVLPFRDLSPAKDLDYLAEGLAEELSAQLGRTPDLQVTALASTRRYANRTDDPGTIGRELGVASLLTGSVRLDGSRLQITATLLDAATGRTHWSASFSRPLDDVFAVEREIAQAILNRVVDDYVAPAATATATARVASTDAYVMYLKGRQEFRRRTPESMRKARSLFEQSLALDPEYAPAYVGVADSVRRLTKGVEGLGDLDPAIAGEVAKQNVDKALLRDPDLPEAYASLGNVAMLQGRSEDALAAFDKALQLNPSYADAHLWRFLVLRNLGRSADAMASLESAQRLDPLSPVILKNWAVEKSRRNENAEALRVFDRIIELDPESPVGYRGAAQVAYSSGDLVRSADYWHEVLKRSPDSDNYRISLGDVFVVAGLPAAAETLMKGEWDVNVAIAARDHARVLEMARFAHASKPDDALQTFETAWYELLWGDREAGRALLRGIDGTILATGWVQGSYCSPHVEMAYAFPPGADRDRWLEHCIDYLATQRASGYSYSELSYLAARVAALRGDVPAAANAFVRAVEQGWRQNWTANDALIASILQEPTVRTALARLETDLAKQRAALEERARRWGYAAGPNPPAPAAGAAAAAASTRAP